MKPRATPGRTTLINLERRTGRKARRAAAAGRPNAAFEELDKLRHGSRLRGVFALLNGNGHGHGSGNRRPGRSSTSAVSVRAYDHGAPIRATGNPRHLARAHSVASAWTPVSFEADGSETIGAFAVESFEESVPRPWDDRLEDVAPAYTTQPTTPVPSPQPVEMPVATALSQGLSEDGLLGLDLSSAARADDADQFEREIQAILSGRTVRPAAAAAMASSAPESPPPAPFPTSAHEIFEQMGHNMAYANAFQLPPIEVRRRFDDLELDVIREEALQERPAAVVSLELSEDEIRAGLTLLPAPPPAQPAPPPAPPAAPPSQDMPPSAAPAATDTPAPTDSGRPTP